jgi:lipoprotein-anchoring transpeptidase ErfK/SrfK
MKSCIERTLSDNTTNFDTCNQFFYLVAKKNQTETYRDGKKKEKKRKKEIENDTLRNAQKKQYRKKIRHEPHKGPISEIMSLLNQCVND